MLVFDVPRTKGCCRNLVLDENVRFSALDGYYTIKQVKFQDNSLKMSETRHCVLARIAYRVLRISYFRIFSPKICLIFVGRGGSFGFSRDLHHVGLF